MKLVLNEMTVRIDDLYVVSAYLHAIFTWNP